MEASTTALEGMLILPRVVHTDSRGTYEVIWNREDISALGLPVDFVQDNLIKTRRGTLRGMHFQSRQPQGKLCTVLAGEVYDVAVDLRPDSPTFGRWQGFLLKSDEGRSLWLPPGFAHGFLALSEQVIYLYKVTAPWDPDAAHALAWNDPDVAIAWPLEPDHAPVLSEKDRAGLDWPTVRKLVAG